MPGAMVKAMLIGWFALAVGVGVRWFRRSSVVERAFTVAAALATTVAFAFVRNEHKLEDTEFLLVLAAFCAIGGGAAAVLFLALRRRIRGLLLNVSFASLLVPALYTTYLFPIQIGICLIRGSGCYGN